MDLGEKARSLSITEYIYVIIDRQRNQKVLLNQVYQQFSVYLGYILTIAGSQTLIGQYAIIREVSSVKYRLRGAFKKINQIKRNL